MNSNVNGSLKVNWCLLPILLSQFGNHKPCWKRVKSIFSKSRDLTNVTLLIGSLRDHICPILAIMVFVEMEVKIVVSRLRDFNEMTSLASLKLAWTELPSLNNSTLCNVFSKSRDLKVMTSSVALKKKKQLVFICNRFVEFDNHSPYWKEVKTFFQSYVILICHQHLLD